MAEGYLPFCNDAPAMIQWSALYTSCKPLLDFVLALLLLVLSAPVLLIAAVLIKLTSRGPILYSQIRLGQYGRPYTIYKLRSMFHNCERATGARWASRRDPRVTLVGRFLRGTHVDELPQLWNILRGEMSLIGPRPERPEFVPTLEKAIPSYRDRLLIRPGLTGLAQVQLPPDSDLESVRRKLSCDLFYVEHVGLWLDLRILVSTAFHVLGVPTPILRTCFRIPSGEELESPVPANNNITQSCTALAN
jgi:lipopolysaccharide/colanic/teichoic acid biosynthesis glycosyltransferase